MFIKNQKFKDEETLLEALFDFGLGDATSLVVAHKETIEKDLADNEAYQKYHASLTDEEDRMELEAEERYIRLAEALMEQFTSFVIYDQKLFGLKDGAETLLYTM